MAVRVLSAWGSISVSLTNLIYLAGSDASTDMIFYSETFPKIFY
jgi:hypothetical protein